MNHPAESLEAEFIRRCQQGDGDAFAQLIQPYRQALYGYLLRTCGDREVAEDVFQETLIKVWRGLPRYAHSGRFQVWLFGIARRAAIDAARRRKVHAIVQYTETVPEQPALEDPADEFAAGELEHIVQQALQQMPEQQRQVFLLRQHSQMPFREIADLLGQPLNTVLSHMHYAVSRLRRLLKDHELI